MLNLKLKTIANLVNKDDVVIDIGCDHAYLAIYLKKEKICKKVYASDISENVIEIANQNIKDNNVKIDVYLSDGFKNISNNDFNTAIISGMGTSTILNIVKDTPENINKYIISSNNNHYELRKEMLKYNFYVQNEVIVKENNKYYPIMLFEKIKQQEKYITLKYGKSNNKDYFNYLLKKEYEILNHIPKKHFIKRLKHNINIKEIKKILKEKN
ncbi:MAG: SAM-dependent methyltransferase [Firmicutes bacterium]|nr:SAM-dependent methyltransferase [Bacillota bacterium]